MSEIDTSIYHRNMTPLIRPPRLNSGTLYVFPSAAEDIGLNLNMRSNRVALSYYALLDIPDADSGATSRSMYASSGSTEEDGSENDNEETDTYSQSNTDINCLNIFNIITEANNYVSNTDSYTNGSSTSGDQLSSVKLAASLQNYMMNFETVLMNDSAYDYSASATVSEHCFWKWLKETGAIRWQFLTEDSDDSTHVLLSDGRPVFEEVDDSDVSTGYQRVVKGFGKISAANSVSNEMGMFNETYVNIPTSYGNAECFFRQSPDDNYKLSHTYVGSSDVYLEGRNAVSNSDAIYTGVNQPFYDYDFTSDQTSLSIKIVDIDDTSISNVWQKNSSGFILSDKSYVTDDDFLSNGISTDGSLDNVITIENDSTSMYTTFKRSRLDAVSLVLDFDTLSTIWEKKSPDIADHISSYDSFSIDTSLCYGTASNGFNYEFNAVLLYYTIYDKDSDTALANNLFGILFLNGPQSTSSNSDTGTNLQFSIPAFTKRKSTGENSSGEFGTGYSFRVNIKTSDIFDDTDAYIQDNTTSDSMYTSDFNGVISQLNNSVNLLRKQTSLVSSIQTNYLEIITLYNTLSGKVNTLSSQLTELLDAKINELDVSTITSKEDDTSILRASTAQIGNGYINTLDVSNLTVGGTYDYNIPYADISVLDTSLLRSRYVSTSETRVENNVWSPISNSTDAVSSYTLTDSDIESMIMDTSIKNTDDSTLFISSDTSSAYPQAFNGTPADSNYYEINSGKFIAPIIRFLQILNNTTDDNFTSCTTAIASIEDKIMDLSTKIHDISASL